MVSGTCCPYVSVSACVMVGGAAVSKGPMLSKFGGARLSFEPQCWDLSPEAGILASRLGFEP